MNKVYGVNRKIIFTIVYVLLACFVASFMVLDSFSALSFFLIAFVFTLGIVLSMYGEWGKVIIDDTGVFAGVQVYFDPRKKLQWDQIRSVEIKKSLGLTLIYLYPAGGKWANLAGRIRLSTLITDSKQMLRDIIMNTYDETNIDIEAVKLAGLTQEDLKNRRSTVLVKISKEKEDKPYLIDKDE